MKIAERRKRRRRRQRQKRESKERGKEKMDIQRTDENIAERRTIT